jgi:HD-GYP domain-containing protein (c-di-GMP phosphodiesterase class II)
MDEPTLSLAELLADLSLISDLEMGHEPETAVRACVVATGFARALDLPEAAVADVYYTALMLHLGCTAYAHEAAAAFGDDIKVNELGSQIDHADPREAFTNWLPAVVRELPVSAQFHAGATFLVRGKRIGADLQRATCEVGVLTARRLGLTAAVTDAIDQGFEWWNGRGRRHLAGEDIVLPVRIAQIATQASLLDQVAGAEAAFSALVKRAGRTLDPHLVAAFARFGPALLDESADVDLRPAAIGAEPEPRRLVAGAELDGIAAAFGDLVDLKSPYTHGHSGGVARLAESAGQHLRLEAAEVTVLRRAGLLHDLGRVAISSAIWDKPGRLTATEWERVRLHPYHTERILARSGALAPIGRVAGMHHERLDGSGYYRQATGREIAFPARVLAAADAFHTKIEPRPHRPARQPDQAAAELREEARQGRLDADAVAAVLAVVGHGRSGRRSWPGGLSDREVEVLRLLAAGCSVPQIARRLVIAHKTADHHVQHIYTKLGISTRAAAALYAMEHDLIADGR